MAHLQTKQDPPPQRVFIMIAILLTITMPFLINAIVNGGLGELSKSVFALYLIVPLSVIIMGSTPSAHVPLQVATLTSIGECLDWRLVISQIIHEHAHIVVNPQWFLVVITAIAILRVLYALLRGEKNLTLVFSIIVVIASLTATYAFHYLVINRGIAQAVSDHEEKMKLVSTENVKQTNIVCSIYRLICLQNTIEQLPELLREQEQDRDSILAINAYAQNKKLFFAWRETDLISSALNGNGVLIGYINNDNNPMVVIDQASYHVRMNREEGLFMTLVILFHIIWIPAWISLSIKHRKIRLRHVTC